MNAKDPQFLQSIIIDGRGHGQTIDAAAVNQWSPEQGLLWVHLDVSDPRVEGYCPSKTFVNRSWPAPDRVTRFLEDLDLARERAVVLQEKLLSLIAQEQNARMYVLSMVAAIFLPLTFVTGMLAMNVGGLPGLENSAGFLWSVIVLIVSAIGLLMFFRWKRWL